MASVTHVPPQPEIEYPDSDGKPMSDHDLQYKWIVVIAEEDRSHAGLCQPAAGDSV
jgi:hypothetical protein